MACKKNKPVDIPVDFEKNPYMDAIYNSATADHPEDSSHYACLTFVDTSFSFGEIHEGDTVAHDFRFVNSGNSRLLITDVNTTCGCTVPQWPKGFIRPGDKGTIHIQFNSAEKSGEQEKEITAVTNGRPRLVRIFLRGYVKPKKALK